MHSPEGFIGYPQSAPESHNGCHEVCDMLSGPCACGAWHALSNWNDTVLAAYRSELGTTNKG